MLPLTKLEPVLVFARGRQAPFRSRTLAWTVSLALLAVLSSSAARAQAVFITGVTVPPAGAYDRTLSLRFTATFNAPVVVTGAPQLALRVGDVIRHATAVTPLGPPTPTTSVTFEYVPAALDRDDDGIEVTPAIDLNGGAIQTVDAKPVQLAFWAPDTRGVRVETQLPPTPRVLGLNTVVPRKTGDRSAGDLYFVHGTADGRSRVIVKLADVGIVGATMAAENGAWSLSYPRSLLTPGTHRLTATAENSAGILSPESAPLDLRVTTPPTAAMRR